MNDFDLTVIGAGPGGYVAYKSLSIGHEGSCY